MLAGQSAKGITILGIDPGLRLTGYGVIQKLGNKLTPLAFGVIKSGEGKLPNRLGKIFTEVEKIVLEYKPDICAIEIVFVNINPQSSLLLGQARGAAICALSQAQKPVTEITALQIKQSVVGYGRASKAQIQKMVTTLLNLEPQTKKISADAADALACAIACALLIPPDNLNLYNQNKSNKDSPIINTLDLFKQQSRRKRANKRWQAIKI